MVFYIKKNNAGNSIVSPETTVRVITESLSRGAAHFLRCGYSV
jgi:hypothetical protein